jgi:hypothetical protein
MKIEKFWSKCRRRNSETESTDKSVSFTDKSDGFLENRCDDFRAVCAENQPNFVENR